MKIHILIILAVYLLFSCSNPESIAEKALKEIGSGKYKSDSYGICFQKLKGSNRQRTLLPTPAQLFGLSACSHHFQ